MLKKDGSTDCRRVSSVSDAEDAENVSIFGDDFVFFARKTFAFDQLSNIVIRIGIIFLHLCHNARRIQQEQNEWSRSA